MNTRGINMFYCEICGDWMDCWIVGTTAKTVIHEKKNIARMKYNYENAKN